MFTEQNWPKKLSKLKPHKPRICRESCYPQSSYGRKNLGYYFQ